MLIPCAHRSSGSDNATQRPKNPIKNCNFSYKKRPEILRFQALFGGDKRDRTADLLNAIQALSQLSYTPGYSWFERAVLCANQLLYYSTPGGFVKEFFRFSPLYMQKMPRRLTPCTEAAPTQLCINSDRSLSELRKAPRTAIFYGIPRPLAGDCAVLRQASNRDPRNLAPRRIDLIMIQQPQNRDVPGDGFLWERCKAVR